MHLGEQRGFSLGAAGFGALRVALLFGLMGIALALITVPLVERRSEPLVAGEFDMTTTGSIRSGESYTIRRSVLQPSPNATCIIRSDGSRAGQCD
jgi:hypothetical protein